MKRALPGARVGGPDTTGPADPHAAEFLRGFIEHCARGKNSVTGGRGAPLDFVSFHAKGDPKVVEGHVRMGIGRQLQSIDGGFRIVRSFPEFKDAPIILGESDLGIGTPIPGLDLGNWDGVWVAELQFYLPAWAGDPHFRVNRAMVDDKALLLVNSFQFAFFGIYDATGPGIFNDNLGNTFDVNFDLGQDLGWGWDKELIVGGWNDIMVVMNNTGSTRLDAPARTFVDAGDFTYLSLDARVTFVPEPATWTLLLAIGGFLAASQMRRHR